MYINLGATLLFFQKVSYKVGNLFKEFLISDIKDLVSIGNLFDTSFNFEFKDLLFILSYH